MFEFFRKYNKFAMFFLFLLIIPSFVLFGVEGYRQSGGLGEAVAEVDGQKITQPEWDQRHRNEADSMRQRNPNADPSLFDSDAARYATLERMVRERVLSAAALQAKLTTSDARLSRLFAEDPQISGFYDANGKLDRSRFVLAAGQTPEQYVSNMRATLTTQQLLTGVTGSAQISQAQADVTLNALYDQREVRVALYKSQEFASQVNLSDSDLDGYYKSHATAFQAPEQVDIEYIVLNMDAVKKTLKVGEDELKQYFEQNKARLGTPEERRARHILIAVNKDAPAADREAAKTKAGQLLEELKKSPANFAELAKKHSQDPGSAERGGELDSVTRGAMVKPFEDALFSMEKGGTSELVATDFGYHIIRLEDIKPSVVPAFESVRAQVEGEVRVQMASQEFAKSAELFTDTVYQQADSLQPAADKLKLDIQKASGVMRTAANGAKGVLANRNFLVALFASEALERKNNTPAIDVGANQLAAARVVKHAPARTLPFEEVKGRVKALLTAERAAQLAKVDGEAQLKAWSGGETPAARLGETLAISRNDARSLPSEVVEAALRTDSAKLPAWIGVNLESQAGYGVLKVEKAVARTIAPPEAKQERQQLAQVVATAEATAYYEWLKTRMGARILAPKPAAEVLARP